MQNRLKIALVVAVFFGLIAAYGIYNFLSYQQKEADVLRAANQEIVVAAQQVAARLQLGGRGGIDIRGDGSAVPYTGRLRRRPVQERETESPYEALRRAIGALHPAPELPAVSARRPTVASA